MTIRFKFIITFLFILFLVFSLACKKKASPASPSDGMISELSGTVTLNGQAFMNIDVYLSWGASQKTKTGTDGEYAFSSLLSGAYVITPSKLGYAFNPSNYEISETRKDLNFTAQIASVGCKLGDVAVDFTARNQEGRNVSLYNFFGKVIFFNVSAHTCGFCRQEAEQLESIYSQYKNRGFQLITILISGDAPSWANDYNLTFSILDDSDKSIWNVYGEGSIPLNIILDRNCVIRYKKAGFIESEIKGIIEKYL